MEIRLGVLGMFLFSFRGLIPVIKDDFGVWHLNFRGICLLFRSSRSLHNILQFSAEVLKHYFRINKEGNQNKRNEISLRL